MNNTVLTKLYKEVCLKLYTYSIGSLDTKVSKLVEFSLEKITLQAYFVHTFHQICNAAEIVHLR